MITVAIWIAVVSPIAYVLVGTLLDARRARDARQGDLAMNVLSRALYTDHESLGPMMRELRSIPHRVLFGLALHVPLHFDDQLSRRLLDIVGTTGARRRVRRLGRSRFWHRRIRAARLAHILPANQDLTGTLLADSHPAVRAAAIESLSVDQIALHAERLLNGLRDDHHSVQFTAQQALLRGDGRLVEPLSRELSLLDGRNVLRALEVASNLGDPRLLPAIRRHVSDRDPEIRRLVAEALPLGAGTSGLDLFAALLSDPDPHVRVATVQAVSRLRADWLAGRLGEALRDRSWEVRRAAGNALAELGPIGLLVLRDTLERDDPYAADMAQQVLDGLIIEGRLTTLPTVADDPELDPIVPIGAR